MMICDNWFPLQLKEKQKPRKPKSNQSSLPPIRGAIPRPSAPLEDETQESVISSQPPNDTEAAYGAPQAGPTDDVSSRDYSMFNAG